MSRPLTFNGSTVTHQVVVTVGNVAHILIRNNRSEYFDRCAVRSDVVMRSDIEKICGTLVNGFNIPTVDLGRLVEDGFEIHEFSEEVDPMFWIEMNYIKQACAEWGGDRNDVLD